MPIAVVLKSKKKYFHLIAIHMLVVTEKLLESTEVNLSYRKFEFEQSLPFLL